MGILDKMARKAFERPDIQQSWAVHMQAFGPILGPAFAEDYASRIHLAAALSRISKKDINGALEKLGPLQKKCTCDADFAAWFYFAGLAFEAAGDQGNMIQFYQKANSYGHKFANPYIRVAKCAYADGAYDASEQNFRAAIHCFDGLGLDEGEKIILSSVYGNLASTLILMHRYDEAYQALENSRLLVPEASGRYATEALYHAATGNAALAKEYLQKLEQEQPEAAEIAHQSIDPVIAGTQPHFFPRDIKSDEIPKFWEWFTQNEQALRSKLDMECTSEDLVEVVNHIVPIFTDADQEPQVGVWKAEENYHIALCDAYSLTLRKGYEAMLETIPDTLKNLWEFEIVR